MPNQHARAHTCLIGFAVWVNLCHDNTLSAVVTELLGQVWREVLYTEPHPRRWWRLLLGGTCGLLAWQCTNLNSEFPFLVLPQDLHRGLRARSGHRHDITQLPRVLHGVAIEGHNDIATLEASLGRWGVRRYICHQDSFRGLDMQRLGQGAREFLNAHAEVAPDHLALGHELFFDGFHHVNGDGKPYPRIATAARGDGRIDPNDLPLQVKQGSTGIAGIDRRIALNKVLKVRNTQPAPSLGTDHPHSDGVR